MAESSDDRRAFKITGDFELHLPDLSGGEKTQNGNLLICERGVWKVAKTEHQQQHGLIRVAAGMAYRSKKARYAHQMLWQALAGWYRKKFCKKSSQTA